MEYSIAEITEKVLAGYRFKRGDDLQVFLQASLEELQHGAGVLQKHFCGNHIDFCTIINGRSGRCGEDCKYCAQSACHHTDCEEYGFLPKEEILANARANQDAGANRFAIVTSGRALAGEDFERALDVYRTMHDTLHIGLCASHGLFPCGSISIARTFFPFSARHAERLIAVVDFPTLSAGQLRRLHETGVTSYHHNIETSRRFFPQICTTHTYDDRIRTIRPPRRKGYASVPAGLSAWVKRGKIVSIWPSVWLN